MAVFSHDFNDSLLSLMAYHSSDLNVTELPADITAVVRRFDSTRDARCDYQAFVQHFSEAGYEHDFVQIGDQGFIYRRHSSLDRHQYASFNRKASLRLNHRRGKIF